MTKTMTKIRRGN